MSGVDVNLKTPHSQYSESNTLPTEPISVVDTNRIAIQSIPME